MTSPTKFPKPPRLRWRDYKRYKKLMPAGVSKWQIPVLTITDRSGGRRGDVLPNRVAKTLTDRLEDHIGKDAVLCSDGDAAYAWFA